MSLYGTIFRSVFRNYFEDAESCKDEDFVARVEGDVEALATELNVGRQIVHFMPATGWTAYYHLEEDKDLPLIRDMGHGLLCAFEDGTLSILECQGRNWIDVAAAEGFLGFVGPGGSDFAIREEFERRVKMMTDFGKLSELKTEGE